MIDKPMDLELQDDDDADLGQPIAALVEFEHPVSNGLILRIRRKIQRRTAARQLTSFASGALSEVLREFWLLMVGTLRHQPARKE